MASGNQDQGQRPQGVGGDDLIVIIDDLEGRSVNATLKRLFTVKEAAVYLGTTPAAVYMKIWRGIIPALRDGRRVRIERFALEGYVSSRMRPYASPNAG